MKRLLKGFGTISIIAPLFLASCSGFKSKLFGYKENYDENNKVYTIHLDAFYKQSPLWKDVVKRVRGRLNKLGLNKFKIKYTEQDVENYTKDKMSQLGYTDPEMPDIFRLSYGDISIMNIQRAIMPFPSEWIQKLKLNVDHKDFNKYWGGPGVQSAILRGTPDRNGNIDKKKIQYVGLPYSLNTSVMAVRNSLTHRIGDNTENSIPKLTPSNVNDPRTIYFLKEIKSVGQLEVEENINANNFSESNNKIPASYEEITKIIQKSLGGKGRPMIDIYGKHVFVDKDGNMVRFDGDPNKGTKKYKKIVSSGDSAPIELTENQLIKDPAYDFYYTNVPSFFNRMDIWSELGQFLGVAKKNDEKENTDKRSHFLWQEEKNGKKTWHYILKDSDNPGARKIFKIIFDQIYAQAKKDKSWYDPTLRIDASFYNLVHGSRLFPITGAWDLPVVEKKFMQYALNLSTDDELEKIYDSANEKAKKELDRIKDEATTFRSLTEFKTANNVPITPFTQIAIVAVNGRINQNAAKWNPKTIANDGKTYSKKDVIQMILEEFVSTKSTIPTIKAQQVSPLNIPLRTSVTNSPQATGNYKDYFDAQTPIIQTGVGGPRIQFWYELQAITDSWVINDIRTAQTLSVKELKANFKKQSKINRNPSVTINSPIDEIRFQYAYNILIDKLDTDIRTKTSLTQGQLV